MLNKFITLIAFFSCLLSIAANADKSSSTELTTQNPIDFTLSSIRRGKQFYIRHCTLCHGADGKGDTQMREFLKTHPANFTDQKWIYGNSDAQLFDVIKNGRLERDMGAFGEQLSDLRIWHTINYIRFLNGKKPE